MLPMPKVCRTPAHSSARWPRSSAVAEADEALVDQAKLAGQLEVRRDLAPMEEADAGRFGFAATRRESGELQQTAHPLHGVVRNRELTVRRRDALLRFGVLVERTEH